MSQIERWSIVTPLSMVTPKAPRWAWQDRVPLNGLTMFSGTGGIGKSTVLAWLCSGFTNGNLPGDLEGLPCNVLMIAAEDDLDTVLANRMRAVPGTGCFTTKWARGSELGQTTGKKPPLLRRTWDCLNKKSKTTPPRW